MHLYTRFSLLLSAFFLCLFYRASDNLVVRYGKATGHFPTRLIIFGNSLAAPQPKKPEVWSTLLCHNLNAKCDNFAKASSPESNELGGAVIDKLIFETRTPDFRAQVEEFIKKDEEDRKNEAISEKAGKELYFVSFGVEEFWRVAEMKRYKDASWAIDSALDTLFEQLDVLATRRPGGIEVVVMTGLDVTILPAWANRRHKKDIDGQMNKASFQLFKQYTSGLALRAKTWDNGNVYIWDSALWHVEEIRHPEKHGWKEVWKACVEGEKTCENPDEYLMWDDVLLSSRAQSLIAAQIVKALW